MKKSGGLGIFCQCSGNKRSSAVLAELLWGGGGGGGLCTTQNAPVVEWYRHVLGGNL